jgi:UDP-glucose 4-epimerase
MKVLFTGASSFTGFSFVRELTAAGHELTLIFPRSREAYEGLRAERMGMATALAEPLFEMRFGDDRFQDLIRGRSWDLLCHHAADVTDYKSPDFDIMRAVGSNTHRLRDVLAALRDHGCRHVLLTGSVFEGGEGAGSDGLPPFSPYGLSKQLTAEVFRYFTAAVDMQLGKFVISNPFGPYEEPRFTAYLVRTWAGGDTAGVRTPAYIRDNIHVSLLARAYSIFAKQLVSDGRPILGRQVDERFTKLNPSGYVESQGTFAERFAREMRARLGWECRVELSRQTEFSEPRIRINTDPLNANALGWDETAAWDEIAAYYERSVAGRGQPTAGSQV